MSLEFILGAVTEKDAPIRRLAPAGAQAFVPLVVYSQPPTLNIGDNPGAGSVSVPVKDPVVVRVPRSSIPEPLPAPALKIRSAKPSVKRTLPVSGRTTVAGGFCPCWSTCSRYHR